jgi:hypothetical protein
MDGRVMLNRLLGRRRRCAAERVEPAEQAVIDGLPAEVALVIEGLTFFDRGVLDIETGARRVVAMAPSGRSGFPATHEGASNWLRQSWPGLSAEQVDIAAELIHARMVAFMRNAGVELGRRSRNFVRDWMEK